MEKVRHSIAHILAMSIKKLYPDAKLGIGPAIDNGFYYDFDNLKITEQDLKKIEKEMKGIIKKDIAFEQEEISKKEALKLFKDEPYKIELINELEGDTVSIFKNGDFVDLCKGPHIKSTKEINPDAFKLDKLAGAYWKGDENKAMLTRIYGLAFKTEEELEHYQTLQEEAQKRDHRILGQRLELFMFDEEVGAGLPLWLPKGALLRKLIQDYLTNELLEKGYELVATPHIGKINLWKTSGHWENYHDDLYSPIEIDEEKYLLKPMNCPFHVKLFQSKPRSYKELPKKWTEFGTVYRYERSGTLQGLTRVRGFTQDDAHIWCTKEQVEEEVDKLLKHGLNLLKRFGFENFNIYLSTRPEKHIGDEKDWDRIEKTLEDTIKKNKLQYKVDEGGGVFYGPKIDIKIKDALDREWQCTTIQIDFNLTERFDINFINEQGERERPYMLHRALIGSLERFIAVLIEHHAGAFPFWLSPIQISIIPIGEAHREYAQEVKEQLKNFRVEIKEENETVSKKIREAEMERTPYILVIGDNEVKNKTVTVRERGNKDLGEKTIEEFTSLIGEW